MIIITGSVRIRPEHRAEALALGIEHSARSRAEPGCLAHNCHIDAEDAARIVFVEQWADAGAVRAHFALEASRAFVGQIAAMAEAPPVMEVWEASKVAI